MTVSKKSISVILPNFNGKDLLEEFIPSIFEALHFSNLEYELPSNLYSSLLQVKTLTK